MKKSHRNEEYDKLSLQLQYLFEFGVDLKNRVIQLVPEKTDEEDSFSREIDSHHFSFIDAALTELESRNRSAITIRIHSYGGSVKAALGIVGRITSSKCKIMHHEASYTVEGRHSEAKAYVFQAEKEEKQWAKWMAEFSNKQASFYEKQGIHKDVYWTPEELLEFGIVDKIF
jgi:ATP-dependent protease ClpP protease subunit